jgi:hypothetical protein
MSEYIGYGPWVAVKCCPECGEAIDNDQIFNEKVCKSCGYNNGPHIIAYDTAIIRKAYIKKSFIPFFSKWEYQEKCRNPFAGTPSKHTGQICFSSLNGVPLTTLAAVSIIM